MKDKLWMWALAAAYIVAFAIVCALILFGSVAGIRWIAGRV